jgi:hypothetical protein
MIESVFTQTTLKGNIEHNDYLVFSACLENLATGDNLSTSGNFTRDRVKGTCPN